MMFICLLDSAAREAAREFSEACTDRSQEVNCVGSQGRENRVGQPCLTIASLIASILQAQ